jgi:hypothetical protein
VKQEKGESCNGNSTDPKDWDYHVYIAKDSGERRIANTVVVEVTPYTRSVHPEFTLYRLRKLRNHKVRVTGWILYDFEHLDVSAGSNPEGKKEYRQTVYELHPVTNIEEVSMPNS